MVCCRYSRAYLRHLMQAGEALSATLNTIHNLAYYLGIMKRVRASLQAEAEAITDCVD
jgi:queuine tRNA-ribosyltransferase